MVARSIARSIARSSAKSIALPASAFQELYGIESSALVYTEADAATQISATISARNEINFTSAVISITGNFQSGEDVLAFADTGTITGNLVAGVMTLSGSDTVANYQAALRAVTYDNTNNDNPSGLNRTISFKVNDGSDSNTLTRIINVVGVSDPPVLASIEGGAIAYTANDPATLITGTLAITDVDDTDMESAVVAITSNFQTGEDVLAFADTPEITGSYASGTGILTLTGTDTIASWEVALRSVTYDNTSGTPNTSTRTVSFTVNDGDDDSNTLTRDIAVSVVTDIYGHFDGSTHYLSRTKVSEIIKTSAYSVALWYRTTTNASSRTLFAQSQSSTDRMYLGIYFTDAQVGWYNGATVQSSHDNIATDGTWHHLVMTYDGTEVTVNGYYDGAAFSGSASSMGTSATQSLNVGSTSAAGQLFDGGIKGVKVYSDVLTVGEALWLATEGVSGDDPGAGNLVYDWDIDEASGSTIVDDIGAVNLTLTGNAPRFWGSALLKNIEVAAIDYTENDPPVVLTSTLTVTGGDGVTVASALAEITTAFVTGEDVLGFVTLGAISGVWDSAAGTMTLTGDDTLANYQAALRTITYVNLSADPSGTTRTVSLTVNDGIDSNTVTRDIDVTPVTGDPTPQYSPYLSSVFVSEVNTRIEAATVPDVALATDYTMCCHVKVNAASDATIMAISQGSADRHGLFIDDQGAIGGGYYDTDYTNTKRGANASAVVGTWYHLALVYEATGGTIKVYVDGVEVSETEGFANRSFPATAGTIFGASSDGVAHGDFAIQDARVYNEVKTAAEIAKIADFSYEQFPRPTTPQDPDAVSSRDGLVARWVFDGTIEEYINGNYHGTGYNFSPALKTVTKWVDIDNEGGTENGNTLATAWGSIQEGVTDAVTGDVIFVMDGTYNESVTISKHGIRIVGRCDAYDTPIAILEPAITAITWTDESATYGPDVWTTTDIPAAYVLSYDGLLIPKLGTHYLGDSDSQAAHGFTLLSLSVGQKLTGYYYAAESFDTFAAGDGSGVDFWATINSLWGQSEDFATDGKTYIRFADGRDPNGVNIRHNPGLAVSPGILSYGYDQNNIERMTIQGFHDGILGRNGTDDLEVRYCRIRACIYGVNLRNPGNDCVVSDTHISWNWDGADGGAWAGGSSVFTGEKEFKYLFAKYVSEVNSTRGNGVQVYYTTGGAPGTIIQRNTLTNLMQGINGFFGIAYPEIQDWVIRNNIVEKCSSTGVFLEMGQWDTLIYGNTLIDNAIMFRFGTVDTKFTVDTSIYIFDNLCHNPSGIGTFNQWHSGGSSTDPFGNPDIFIYHNSVSGGVRVMNGFSFDYYGGLPGVHYLNNIFSCPIFDANPLIDPPAELGTWDYNWLGGPTSSLNRTEPWFGANNIDVGGDTYLWPLTSTLTQLTIDGDSVTTPSAAIQPDGGGGAPYFSHCNDAPDGLSSDYMQNDLTETSGTAWFTLSSLDTNFYSMVSLNIDVDVQSVGFGNDTCTLTARIFAGPTSAIALTDETTNLATQADSTRTQRNVSFTGVRGTPTQWSTAEIRFTWTYSKTGGPDNANLRLFGVDIDGVYEGTPTWIIPGSHAAEGSAKVITPAFALGGTNFTDNIQPDATAIANIASPPDMGAVNL